MEISIKKDRRTYTEEGITFAEVTLAIPTTEDEGPTGKRLTRYYTSLADGALQIGERLLLPRSRARYEASVDPRRRFRHRPYCLTLTATLSPCGEDTEVTRILTLTHRGRRLYSETVKELITPEGYVIPKASPKKGRKTVSANRTATK